MTIREDNSTLIILVPEAEALVAPFRQEHDPSAAAGMPAHITLLYPFMPATEINEPVLEQLRSLFCSFAKFDFRLAQSARFPDTLYLAPEPERPFEMIVSRLAEQFPDFPPYGGIHETVIPHLTIAHAEDDPALDAIEASFLVAADGRLPLEAVADCVWLYENRGQGWQSRALFNFELA